MAAPLDLDQLQTFIAIADTGSFTKAADDVHRTQSAVSMQMRRLEERVGKTLFEKEGRTNRLTDDGERLLVYARRLMQLNRETLAAFDDAQLEGHVRIGTPDDYADRFLPEIMARFARSNPRVELTVICEPTPGLVEHIKRGNLDLALVTHNDARGQSEVVRREPLLWVTSTNHATHEEPVLPMAFGRPNCIWRRAACDVLEREPVAVEEDGGDGFRERSARADDRDGATGRIRARMRAEEHVGIVVRAVGGLLPLLGYGDILDVAHDRSFTLRMCTGSAKASSRT